MHVCVHARVCGYDFKSSCTGCITVTSASLVA